MLDTMNMPQTRVAILATSEKTQQRLSSLLEDAGLNVVAHDLPSDGFLSQLENASADVLLVDLSEESGSETDIIDTLLDYDSLPIFFNDSSPAGGGANSIWAKKLARKLSAVAESHQQVSDQQATGNKEQIDIPSQDADAPTIGNPANEELTLEDTTSIEFSTDLQGGDNLAEELEIALEDTMNTEFSADLQGEPNVAEELDLVLEETPTTNQKTSDKLTADDSTAIELSSELQGEAQLAEDLEVTLEETPAIVQPAEAVAHSTAAVSVEKPEGAAINIWVLGASLGGPQAVRQFLAAIKDDLPVAFVLAQHIGANHISLLAEQLNRVTPFTVLAGRAGHLIKHHEVILTPADKDIKITDDGYLSLIPADENAIYSPSIDNVMDAVARHYGNMAGTIVFSGMGDDGARGCESMARYGGIVWAQDVDSCVISSMPDQARKTNTVTFSANPQALAERLYDYYRD
jgi:chemotaxis response regulator CheB